MTHLAMAFTIAHPGVTSALLGPRTMDHLDDLLAGLDVTLTDDILDRIDEIVPPGTDVGTLDQAYQPPALQTRACAAAPRPNAPQPDHSSPPRRTGEVATPGLNWAERFEDACSGNAAPSEPERCARHSCAPAATVRFIPVVAGCHGGRPRATPCAPERINHQGLWGCKTDMAGALRIYAPMGA